MVFDMKMIETMKNAVLESANKNRRLFTAVLINFLVVVTCFIFLFFTEKTDDYIMKQILDGAYSGTPDAHLLFCSYFLGIVLRLLQSFVPQLPWFELSQLAALFVSYVVITYFIWDDRSSKKSLFFLLPFLLTFGFDSYAKLTFTKTAGVVIAAGLLWLSHSIEDRKKISCLFSVLLTLLGSFYRIKCMYLVAAVFGGFSVADVIVTGYRQQSLKDCVKKAFFCIAPIAGMVVLAFALNVAGTALFTADDAWREYKEYNKYKVELQDRGWPSYDGHLEEYEALGITRNDYVMWAQNRDYSDPDRYNTEMLMKVCEFKDQNNTSIRDFLRIYPLKFTSFKLAIALLFICAAVVCSNLNGKWFYVFAAFCACTIFEYYFWCGNRFGRYHTDYILFFAVAVCLLARVKTACVEATVVKVSPVILALLLAFILDRDYKYISSDTYDGSALSVSEGVSRLVMDELSADKENLYVLSNSELYGLIRAYGVSESFVPGAWSNIFPLNGYMVPTTRKVLDNYDVKNIYFSMLTEKNIYYVTSTEKERLNTIRTYLKEHYHGWADYTLVERMGSVEIYRFFIKPKMGTFIN